MNKLTAAILPARALDERGRCCGRKPLIYKRPFWRYFCTRCDAEYDYDRQQRPNFAWLREGTGFVARYPDQEYAERGRLALEQDGAER